jgi:hypothetical protein
MSKPDPSSDQALSASLRRLLRSRASHLNFGDIIEQFEDHGGLGQVLFILTLPVLLPLPPGASMVLALPLLMAAPQIMIGRRHLKLPHWLSRRSLERTSVDKTVHRMLPLLERVETLARPRLGFVCGRAGTRLAGLAATLIAVVLVLPIPFANLLPALAVGLIALGLTRKDGAMVLAGYGLMGLAVVAIAFGAHGLRMLYHHIVGH